MNAGTRIGPYQVAAPIGAGGMGEVFRARDTRLNRDVAVKVLPKDFVADADRLRRFEQEARTLAALNHPNVLTIHDAGIHEGTPYLVSELLEGKTLREEMNGEALTVRKATEYALQIALGLAAAHGNGVIHRDLKPENIFITKDARVKILDFGLARLRPPVAVDAPRRASTSAASAEQTGGTIRIDEEAIVNTTEPGMVLGTPAYMSPEQVRGEPADHRADIFAFGAVLYEMLSGIRAFRRSTPVASMNAVLSEDPPDLTTSNTNIPPALERIVCRCLEKQPQRRFQSADDLAFAIENAGAASGASSRSLLSGSAQPGFSLLKSLPWGLAALCLAGFVFAVLQWKKPLPTQLPTIAASVRKFELTLPVSVRQRAEADLLYPAISPDGKKLVFANADGLWLRWLDKIAPLQLLTPGERISDPFWSPQSTDVAYFAGRKVFRIGIAGGHPALVATAPEDVAGGAAGGAWLGDRMVFVTGGSALLEVPAQGGKVTTALPLSEGDLDFHNASALPGNRGVLFVIHRAGGTSDTIAAMDSSGRRKVLLEIPASPLWNPVFAPPNHVLFHRIDESRGIWAFPISLDTIERTGPPFRVSDFGASPSAAADGTIAYSLTTWDILDRWQLTWVERSGKILNSIGPPLPGLMDYRLSPDERRVVAVAGESLTEREVWLFNLADGSASPFTKSPEPELWPGWLNGGRAVVFTRTGPAGNQMLSASADGTTEEQLLFDGGGMISQSGKFLLVSQKSPKGGVTRGYISLTDPRRKFIAFPENFQRVYGSTLSTDDRALAFHSIESGRFEVYRVDFPAFTNKTLVSRQGGQHPEWHPKGRELFYLADNGRTLMSRKLESDGTMEEAAVDFILPEAIQGGYPWFASPYSVAEDGQRILMLKRAQETNDGAARPNVHVVMNWFEAFRPQK